MVTCSRLGSLTVRWLHPAVLNSVTSWGLGLLSLNSMVAWFTCPISYRKSFLGSRAFQSEVPGALGFSAGIWHGS